MLKSLENIDFSTTLKIYVIGEKGYNTLKSKGYSCYFLETETIDCEKSSQFRMNNWHNITKRKFEIIYNNLLEHKYVCFTDGDIVFQNTEFMKYCLSNISINDMLIQNDTMFNNDTSVLCSGFMFIKSNNKTLDFFNPKNVYKFVKPGWDDQIYVNQFKYKLIIDTLPLEYFPNGKYYYTYSNILYPYLIHFNWLIGNEKKNKMLKYNKWFIN